MWTVPWELVRPICSQLLEFSQFSLSKLALVHIIRQMMERSRNGRAQQNAGNKRDIESGRLIAMKAALEQSDSQFLNDLHRIGPHTVQEICSTAGVTATAVRQRLARLQGSGLVARDLVRSGRGRPHYVYRVTEKGLRQLGDNYGDLALILWRAVRGIPDADIRESITTRVRDALVARLGRFGDGAVHERLQHLREALLNRGYDVELGSTTELPILRENNCPYQELAEEDRGICDLELEVFRQSLGAEVRLTQCCLDGHHCCEFEVGKMEVAHANA